MAAAADVLLPIVALVLGGYLAGRSRLLGDGSSEVLNRFVYYAALPPLLFVSTARVAPERIFDWPFIAAYGGGALATFVVSLSLSRAIFRHRREAMGILGMAAVYGNTGYVGIPLAQIAFGQEGGLLAVITTVINNAAIVPVVALILASGRGGGAASQKGREIGAALLRNPLIWGSLAGIIVSLMGLALPRAIDSVAASMGAAAGPCALFALGLFLAGRDGLMIGGEVGMAVTLKLLLQPAATGLIALVVLPIGFQEAAIAIVLAAIPTGATVFVMAQNHGVEVRSTSAITVLSTLLSVVTLSFLLAYLIA